MPTTDQARAARILNTHFGPRADNPTRGRRPAGPPSPPLAFPPTGRRCCEACSGTGTITIPDPLLGDWVDTECPCQVP